jgi:REP element-mobilizing transposase RayT
MRKKMSSGYLTKNHAKFYLKVHLVLVCKYRKKLLLDNANSDLRWKIIFFN